MSRNGGTQRWTGSGRARMFPQSAANGQTGPRSVSPVAKPFNPQLPRLRLDPATKIYFPDEPGKSHLTSAVRIKNPNESHVAFKFETTTPKSYFMRRPDGVLSPGESIIAVFMFVEQPENNQKPQDQKSKVLFKLLSLKVKGPKEYVPELFEERKEQVAIEGILDVVFLDVNRPSPQLDKLKRQLAEAESALKTKRKTPEDTGPRIVGEEVVIDKWKKRRELYCTAASRDG